MSVLPNNTLPSLPGIAQAFDSMMCMYAGAGNLTPYVVGDRKFSKLPQNHIAEAPDLSILPIRLLCFQPRLSGLNINLLFA